MSDVVMLRGAGWHWRPTWRWDFPDGGDPVKVWSGSEILVDANGEILRRDDRGRIGQGIGFCALIQRQASPPDRPVPTDEEMEANRARNGPRPSARGAA